MEQAEQDPDFVALARQFKLTAMELITLLEQVHFELYMLLVLFMVGTKIAA